MFGHKEQPDYARARARMVEQQIRPRDISDKRVLETLREVPRHLFVPPAQRSRAYADRPLSIGHGQTISQPFIVAYMTAALELFGWEKVLEIGTGSGYQTAILSRLAREVVSIEYVQDLAQAARATLDELGYDNVQIVVGDGSCGVPEEAPFDAIILTAAAPEVPPPLFDQLADGGRLVGPIGSRYDQVLVRVRRHGDEWDRELLVPVIFVPLLGEHGWKD
jgi:protein-L-isoaspartate(D-aspartate) O-methyltransferase